MTTELRSASLPDRRSLSRVVIGPQRPQRGGPATHPGKGPGRLTDVILHGSLEEVVHVLSVQAVQGHADLVMQPLQPQLCKTAAPPASPPASLRAPGKRGVYCEPSARNASPPLATLAQPTEVRFFPAAPNTHKGNASEQGRTPTAPVFHTRWAFYMGHTPSGTAARPLRCYLRSEGRSRSSSGGPSALW